MENELPEAKELAQVEKTEKLPLGMSVTTLHILLATISFPKAGLHCIAVGTNPIQEGRPVKVQREYEEKFV